MKTLPHLLLALFAAASLCAATPAAAPAAKPAAPPAAAAPRVPDRPLTRQVLAGPLRDAPEIVFAVRMPYNDPHWYANIGYYCDDENKKAFAGNGAADAGKLCRLDTRTGQAAVIFDAQGGGVRDPQVHYEGRKILFSHRKAGTDFYHLYEVDADGSNLKQLTSGEFDDIEPAYLPDGGIVFVSTRCKRWVNCWMTQVAVMYRCDANGRDIRLISANTEHDNTPWVLPDGRILYTRWEYVDRSQVEYHGLWTANPDGTSHAVFYGNMHSWTVMIDAKPVPGSSKILANFSPGHGVTDHAGIPTFLSADGGPDDLSATRPLRQGGHVRDPYPLSESSVLAARKNELVLMDAAGRLEVLYTWKSEGGLHEPRPLMAHPRERKVLPRVVDELDRGQLVLADVYVGRNMAGVKRGEIKKLLVLEQLPKAVNFSGGPDLTSFLGTFTLERVLGTVPVAEDGSAYFEAPADRPLFFVALDKDDLSVKRMQSWTSLRPGEVSGCVGCHESRGATIDQASRSRLQAVQHPVSKITPFEGFPDVLDFHRDVQPVLDRHCVSCHNPRKRDGGILLTGGLGPQFAHSYISLLFSRQVVDGRNGLGNQPPRSIGSFASPLLKYAKTGHYDVKVSDSEWRTLWLWVESGAPYAGSYAGLRNEAQQARAGSSQGTAFGGAREVLQRRCVSCHPAGGDRALPYPPEL